MRREDSAEHTAYLQERDRLGPVCPDGTKLVRGLTYDIIFVVLAYERADMR
jgi:hypothetical protein